MRLRNWLSSVEEGAQTQRQPPEDATGICRNHGTHSRLSAPKHEMWIGANFTCIWRGKGKPANISYHIKITIFLITAIKIIIYWVPTLRQALHISYYLFLYTNLFTSSSTLLYIFNISNAHTCLKNKLQIVYINIKPPSQNLKVFCMCIILVFVFLIVIIINK